VACQAVEPPQVFHEIDPACALELKTPVFTAQWRSERAISPFSPPFGGFWADPFLVRRRERCQGQPFPHPYQVVSREAEQRLRSHLGPPAQFGLPHRPDGLAPAEDLLNPFAHPEADGVAGLGRDGVGHGVAPVRDEVLGDVRRDARRLQVALRSAACHRLGPPRVSRLPQGGCAAPSPVPPPARRCRSPA